jgi:hypothetical protein
MEGVTSEVAHQAMKLAAHKLSVSTQVVHRGARERAMQAKEQRDLSDVELEVKERELQEALFRFRLRRGTNHSKARRR